MPGRVPMHPGRGPGLTARQLGEKAGVEVVTLSEAQMPNHGHTLRGDDDDGDSVIPQGNFIANGNQIFRSAAGSRLGAMAVGTLPDYGGGQSHNNLHPFLTLNFIIAVTGVFPSRN